MDGLVYAFMIGVDEYVAPIPVLRGCVNDVNAIEAVLQGRLGDRPVVHKLFDAHATRDNVVAGFRNHLMSAAGDDVAMFVYAGHGSEEPAGPEYERLEPTKRIQTLVLHDTGRRIDGKVRRALADKELAMRHWFVGRSGPAIPAPVRRRRRPEPSSFTGFRFPPEVIFGTLIGR